MNPGWRAMKRARSTISARSSACLPSSASAIVICVTKSLSGRISGIETSICGQDSPRILDMRRWTARRGSARALGRARCAHAPRACRFKRTRGVGTQGIGDPHVLRHLQSPLRRRAGDRLPAVQACRADCCSLGAQPALGRGASAALPAQPLSAYRISTVTPATAATATITFCWMGCPRAARALASQDRPRRRRPGPRSRASGSRAQDPDAGHISRAP